VKPCTLQLDPLYQEKNLDDDGGSDYMFICLILFSIEKDFPTPHID